MVQLPHLTCRQNYFCSTTSFVKSVVEFSLMTVSGFNHSKVNAIEVEDDCCDVTLNPIAMKVDLIVPNSEDISQDQLHESGFW